MNNRFAKLILPVVIAGSFIFMIQPDELSARGGGGGGGGHGGGGGGGHGGGGDWHGGGHGGGDWHGGGGDWHGGDHGDWHHDNNYYYEGGGWGGGVYIGPGAGVVVEPTYYEQDEWNNAAEYPAETYQEDEGY